MSARTRNSTHTLVGGPRRDRYSDVSPRPPVLGLHGTNGSSSVQYPGRFPVPRGAAASPPFSTPPPSDLPERTGPCQPGALRPRPCLAGSPSSGLFEGQAPRSWSDANSTGRRPPGQSSGWDCELPATHSWRASNRRPVASGCVSRQASRTASPAQLHTLADGWPLIPLAQPESLRAISTCTGLRSWHRDPHDPGIVLRSAAT